jgi:7-keto-8-aminopelargonate synthetase-like enzyme
MSSRHDRLQRLAERTVIRAINNRSAQIRVEDDLFEGAHLTIDGTQVVDFGSCSYLGINRDPALKAAANDAVERFGTGHSSSPMYTAVGLYDVLEQRLAEMVEASVAVTPTTTLAHLAALPVLAGPDDLVLIDQYSHASLQLAADVLRGRGVLVELVPHNDVDALQARLDQAGAHPDKIWYIADGVYSMFGDTAPVRKIHALLDEYPSLHLYYDDAHGFGWQGIHGRGYVLSQVDWHDRMVVAAGFAKSFGTTGGLLAFGDPTLAQRVRYTGGPLTFSGPLQPASLGASIASADFHLSAAHRERQLALLSRIELARVLLHEYNLPVASDEDTPIWFIKIGNTGPTLELARKVMGDGYYVNPSGYPAVPVGSAGIRFTQTLHQSEDQLRGLIHSIASHMPDTEPEIVVDLRTEVPVVITQNP